MSISSSHPNRPGPFRRLGLTLVLPLTTALPVGTKLNLFRVNPANGTLIPAFDAGGSPIVGTVDAGGNSATFTGIVTFSTVVALRPEKVMGDLNGDGVVDCKDLAIVKASFGKRTGQAGFNASADINNNGVVDINDLAFVSKLLPKGTVCSK